MANCYKAMPVTLYEMRPVNAKHQLIIQINLLSLYAVTRLRSNGLTNAVGVLKEEMRHIGFVDYQCAADACCSSRRSA